MPNDPLLPPVRFSKRYRRRRRFQFTVRAFFVASLVLAIALPIAQLLMPQACEWLCGRLAEEAELFLQSPASQLPWLCLPSTLLLSVPVVCVTMLLRPNQAAFAFVTTTVLALSVGIVVFTGGGSDVYIAAMKDVSLRQIALVVTRFAVFFLPIATFLGLLLSVGRHGPI